jgi:hypothetical protein
MGREGFSISPPVERPVTGLRAAVPVALAAALLVAVVPWPSAGALPVAVPPILTCEPGSAVCQLRQTVCDVLPTCEDGCVPICGPEPPNPPRPVSVQLLVDPGGPTLVATVAVTTDAATFVLRVAVPP